MLNQIKTIPICLEIPIYCINSSSPSLVFANSPTLVVTVYDSTFFTCNFGYESTGGSIKPYYKCNQYNSTVGQWSNITYVCIRMLILQICLQNTARLYKLEYAYLS